MIKFLCNNPDCDNNIVKVFQDVKLIPPFLDCGACGTGKLERQLGAPGSHKTQIVDNGIQSKQVEVSDEVVEKETKRLYNEE